MIKENHFTIKSIIEIIFKDPHLCDISYKSFSPEFKKLQTKRSEVLMEKRNRNSLVFHIESKDFTAFKAQFGLDKLDAESNAAIPELLEEDPDAGKTKSATRKKKKAEDDKEVKAEAEAEAETKEDKAEKTTEN